MSAVDGEVFDFVVGGLLEDGYDIFKVVDLLSSYYEISRKECKQLIYDNTQYGYYLDEKPKNVDLFNALNKIIFSLSKRNPDKSIVDIVVNLDLTLSRKNVDAFKYILKAIKHELRHKGKLFGFYMGEFKKIRPTSCDGYVESIINRDWHKE